MLKIFFIVGTVFTLSACSPIPSYADKFSGDIYVNHQVGIANPEKAEAAVWQQIRAAIAKRSPDSQRLSKIASLRPAEHYYLEGKTLKLIRYEFAALTKDRLVVDRISISLDGSGPARLADWGIIGEETLPRSADYDYAKPHKAPWNFWVVAFETKALPYLKKKNIAVKEWYLVDNMSNGTVVYVKLANEQQYNQFTGYYCTSSKPWLRLVLGRKGESEENCGIPYFIK